MLSKKTQYPLKALEDLVNQNMQQPVLISEIAEGKKISIKFLETILLTLKQNDVLDSKKGKGGGCFFKQTPKKISVASVIRIMDGAIALLPCVSLNFYQKCDDCDQTNCNLNKLMALTRDVTLKVLEKKTIADLKRKF
jgi:Rrf2 family protein